MPWNGLSKDPDDAAADVEGNARWRPVFNGHPAAIAPAPLQGPKS